MNSATVVLSRWFSRRCGRLYNPHQPYFYLEEKSMKKVLAFLIFVGLCTAVFVSSPVSSQGRKDKLRKNANKVENSYIVVLDDTIVGERGRFSIAPYIASELALTHRGKLMRTY
jgi:hypothetical protein